MTNSPTPAVQGTRRSVSSANNCEVQVDDGYASEARRLLATMPAG